MPTRSSKKRTVEELKSKSETVIKPEVSSLKLNDKNSPTQLFEINAALSHLIAVDPKMAATIKNITKLSPFHEKEDDKSTPFESLVRAIIYQQLATKAATSIFEKFKALFSLDQFPTPAMVLAKTPEELRVAGISAKKASYLLDLSQKFSDGTIPYETFSSMSDEEISKSLISVKGIGQWSADMFLMFYLKRQDILPTLDLGIKKGMIKHFEVPKKELNKKGLIEHETMVKLAEVWKPYRSLGSWYMWQILDFEKEKLKKEKEREGEEKKKAKENKNLKKTKVEEKKDE